MGGSADLFDQCSSDFFLNIKYKVCDECVYLEMKNSKYAALKQMTLIRVPDSKLDPRWVVLQT